MLDVELVLIALLFFVACELIVDGFESLRGGSR